MIDTALANLERLQNVIDGGDDGDALTSVMDEFVDTSTLDEVRGIVKGQIDSYAEYEDPYLKGVNELLSVHEGVPDVLEQLFGVSFDGQAYGHRMDRAVGWVTKDPANFRKALDAWDGLQESGKSPDRFLVDAMNDYDVSGPGLNRKPTMTTDVGVKRLEQHSLDGSRGQQRRANKMLGVTEREELAEQRVATDRELREEADRPMTQEEIERGGTQLPVLNEDGMAVLGPSRKGLLTDQINLEGILPEADPQADAGRVSEAGAPLGGRPSTEVQSFMDDPKSSPEAVESLRKFWGGDDVSYAGGAGTYDTARGAKEEQSIMDRDASRAKRLAEARSAQRSEQAELRKANKERIREEGIGRSKDVQSLRDMIKSRQDTMRDARKPSLVTQEMMDKITR